jgi:hypothetical protein
MTTKQKPQPWKTPVDLYMTQPVLWGGEWSTRGEIIRTMQSDGWSGREITAYLMGLDQSQPPSLF